MYSYLPGQSTTFSDIDGIAELLIKFHDSKIQLNRINIREKIEVETSANEMLLFDEADNDELVEKIKMNMNSYIDVINKYPTASNIVHGDYTLNNVLYNKNSYYIIDLDTLRIGHKQEDLASFILSLIYMNEEMKINFSTLSHMIHFLKKYCGENISNKELESIIYFINFRCAFELSRHAKDYRYLRRAPGMIKYLAFLNYMILNKNWEEKVCEMLL